MSYESIYRCRLCGEQFQGSVGPKHLVERAFFLILAGEPSPEPQMGATEVHTHSLPQKRPGTGIGDLIGIREVVEDTR